MAKFRRKPQVIELEQFLPDEGYIPAGVMQDDCSQRHYVVTAHNQRVYLDGGEWIAREPNGNGYYPIKPDVKEGLYEPV